MSARVRRSKAAGAAGVYGDRLDIISPLLIIVFGHERARSGQRPVRAQLVAARAFSVTPLRQASPFSRRLPARPRHLGPPPLPRVASARCNGKCVYGGCNVISRRHARNRQSTLSASVTRMNRPGITFTAVFPIHPLSLSLSLSLCLSRLAFIPLISFYAFPIAGAREE